MLLSVCKCYLLTRSNAEPSASGPIHTDSMQSDLPYRFGKVKYALPEFEAIVTVQVLEAKNTWSYGVTQG